MTEAEYATLKVGDVIYQHSDIGSGSLIGRTVTGHGDSLKEATDKSIACVINGRRAIIELELQRIEVDV